MRTLRFPFGTVFGIESISKQRVKLLYRGGHVPEEMPGNP